MKAEHEVAILWMVQLNVRAFLGNDLPTVPQQGPENEFGLGGAPFTQAEIGKMLIESGIFFDFSTSSAMAYSANAYAFALASSSVSPYAKAPGTSGISAIQRPSSSRSISNWNRKSRLLRLLDGLRSLMFYKMRHYWANLYVTDVIEGNCAQG